MVYFTTRVKISKISISQKQLKLEKIQRHHDVSDANTHLLTCHTACLRHFWKLTFFDLDLDFDPLSTGFFFESISVFKAKWPNEQDDMVRNQFTGGCSNHLYRYWAIYIYIWMVGFSHLVQRHNVSGWTPSFSLLAWGVCLRYTISPWLTSFQKN